MKQKSGLIFSLFILVFNILALPNYLPAKPIKTTFPEISDHTEISLITISPGNELYTRFGHSAIRIYDPSNGLDIVYNYGTFNFNEPGFYINFLKGKLHYFLSVYDFDRMVSGYQSLNQSLFEQKLNLTYDQKLEVYNFLNNNYLPENRYYWYDFFYDNCSSRIRDVFQNILKDSLLFDAKMITDHKSFRQLLDEFLWVAPWEDFGIDIVLGLPADKIATSDQYMYLPEKLCNAFDKAVLIRQGKNIPFVKSSSSLFNAVANDNQNGFFTPLTFFWSLFVIVSFVSFWQLKMNKTIYFIDITWFTLIGLAGWIVALLWFATDHIATKDNLNILWLFPGHIFIALLIFNNRLSQFSRYYFLVSILILFGLLICWPILPQQFYFAFIPMMLISILRFYTLYKIKKNYHVA